MINKNLIIQILPGDFKKVTNKLEKLNYKWNSGNKATHYNNNELRDESFIIVNNTWLRIDIRPHYRVIITHCYMTSNTFLKNL